MTEIEVMAEQLRRVHRGEAWHGPSLQEALAEVGMSAAASYPLETAHSIAEIVGHVTSTYREISRRMRGDGPRLTPEEDWPRIVLDTEESWAEAKEALATSHAELLEVVAANADADPDLPVLEGFASLRDTLHGLAHHDAYHAGQIVLLSRGR
jgi:uncharacterized damage-inducible protein DinB